ncbi:MAG: HD domain-containing protein [Firmicutes bacterium]|nr:HD domain-containing protein [Bacillota bacterium]
MLNKAISIAALAHAGQVDKGHSPYILHPLRVMLAMNTELERVCAVLHDVIEDSTVTLDDLRQEKFSEEVIETLSVLTKRQNEDYDAFIDRVLMNETACRVKLADIEDNMDLNRIPNPGEKDRARLKKYKAAKERIEDRLQM